jgi:hypothetical protein
MSPHTQQLCAPACDTTFTHTHTCPPYQRCQPFTCAQGRGGNTATTLRAVTIRQLVQVCACVRALRARMRQLNAVNLHDVHMRALHQWPPSNF